MGKAVEAQTRSRQALSDPVSHFATACVLPEFLWFSPLLFQLKVARRLVDAAYDEGKSTDNITAMVVSFTNGKDYEIKKEYTPGRTSLVEMYEKTKQKHDYYASCFFEHFKSEAARFGITTKEDLEAFKARAELAAKEYKSQLKVPYVFKRPSNPYEKSFHPAVTVLVICQERSEGQGQEAQECHICQL